MTNKKLENIAYVIIAIGLIASFIYYVLYEHTGTISVIIMITICLPGFLLGCIAQNK
jgi:peptidoglycan/LPS O-acetylase OafA/YrhL